MRFMINKIWTEDFWLSATNLKSKQWLYRISKNKKKVVVKIKEVDPKTPMSQYVAELGGQPMGFVICDEGKLKAKELAMDDFILNLVI